ncbi:MAG: cell division ATP-binding protein FtsE [Armatimonadetes bacterium]|nr:cell division ATP-binding protein FtsE [Armatimonadota bacterium]
MIEFRNVSVIYPNNIQALRDVSLRIEKGEFVFIVGPTGTGKSTLLKLIYREEVATSGKAIVNGVDVKRLRGNAIARLRRGIGVVFQDFGLLPRKTARENIAFALYVTGAPRKEIKTRVAEVLDLVGLLDRANAYPDQLSGGEQQRIAIARALVNNPPILLADEPTGNLDPETSLEIIRLLERINMRGTTVVVASHDKHIVDHMKKRVIALDKGEIIRDEAKGTYHELAKS